VRSEVSVFICCGAVRTSTISASKPRQNVRPGKAFENIDRRLFVHECHGMAAPAIGGGGRCGTKAGRQARALQQ
jgi:hypothetical protein